LQVESEMNRWRALRLTSASAPSSETKTRRSCASSQTGPRPSARAPTHASPRQLRRWQRQGPSPARPEAAPIGRPDVPAAVGTASDNTRQDLEAPSCAASESPDPRAVRPHLARLIGPRRPRPPAQSRAATALFRGARSARAPNGGFGRSLRLGATSSSAVLLFGRRRPLAARARPGT